MDRWTDGRTDTETDILWLLALFLPGALSNKRRLHPDGSEAQRRAWADVQRVPGPCGGLCCVPVSFT